MYQMFIIGIIIRNLQTITSRMVQESSSDSNIIFTGIWIDVTVVYIRNITNVYLFEPKHENSLIFQIQNIKSAFGFEI